MLVKYLTWQRKEICSNGFPTGDDRYRQFGRIYYRGDNRCDLGGYRPRFKYSQTWQLIINTGTTIITFLMVFLIQKSQNKDSKAIHLKVNEILASHVGTGNRMVDIENLTEEEPDNTPSYKTE